MDISDGFEMFRKVEEEEIKIKGNVFYEENAERYVEIKRLCDSIFYDKEIEYLNPTKEKPWALVTVHINDFIISEKNKEAFAELISLSDDILMLKGIDCFEITFSVVNIWREEQI